jgi:hypothetical protein
MPEARMTRGVRTVRPAARQVSDHFQSAKTATKEKLHDT